MTVENNIREPLDITASATPRNGARLRRLLGLTRHAVRLPPCAL